MSFLVILRAFVAQIEYSHPSKVPIENTRPTCGFVFPNLRLGGVKMHVALRPMVVCDIRFCHSWPEKSQDACRTSTDSVEVDVRYPTLSLLARKITRCVSHIDRFDSFRSVGRCAIFGFVFLGHEKLQDAYRTSRPIPNGWSMCDINATPC